MSEFGDDVYRPGAGKVLTKVGLRVVLMIPFGALGLALICTILGAPVGIIVLGVAGWWIGRPIRMHPAFKVPDRKEFDD